MVETKHSRPVKLGIIISMFPELHETFIVRELAAMERKGIDFKIVSLQRPRDPVTIEDAKRLMQQRTHYAAFCGISQLFALAKTLLRHPVKFFVMLARLTYTGLATPKELLKSYAILPISFYFAGWFKAQGIHHLHGHWANVPTTACWILSQVDDFSWSAAIHGEDIFSPNPLLEKKLDESRFSVVCTGLFCKHLQNNMHHTHPQDIHLNYHGLDAKVLERIEQVPKPVTAPKALPLVLSIGRLVPTKGHDDLIRAVKLLADQQIPAKLSLIGSGPEESILKQLVTQLGLDQQVHFLGMMEFEAVMDQLQAADVFALAPRMIPGHPPDGIPNVIAEAMAFGIPVVTTGASAIPELIDHERNGLFVEPQDPQALADAIARLLTDKPFSDKLARSAKKKVLEMFNQEKNIDDLIGLFEQYVGPVRIQDTPHDLTTYPRALFVIEALTVGGAEQLVVELANQFIASGRWLVDVICLTKAGALAAELDDRVTLHELHKQPGLDWRLLTTLPNLVKKLHPSVINSHLWTANTWVRATRCQRYAPIIVTEHSRDAWKKSHQRLIDRCLALFTHRLISVSDDTATFYRDEIKIPPHLIQVVNNGISIAKYEAGDGSQIRSSLGLSEDCLLIGTVGRLTAAKNHCRLVQAMDKVVAIVPNTHAVIVGKGDLESNIRAEIERLQLSKHVHLLGNRSDVADLLNAFDLFVLSSDREGHPLSALEAQAAGCPVVLTRVGGNAEAIADTRRDPSHEGFHQVGGILVPADAQALADAIVKLLQNENERIAMSDFARQFAKKHFSMETMVAAYDDLMIAAIAARN